jgi:hypothetical protein
MMPSIEAEKIGFAFWWGGWLLLCWWIITSLIGFPPGIKMLGLAAVTFWVGIRGILTAKNMMDS